MKDAFKIDWDSKLFSKEQTTNQITKNLTTSNVDSRSLNYSPQTDFSYNLIFNSAGATQTTKKEQSSEPVLSQTPTITPSFTSSQSAEQKQTDSLMLPLLLIGAGAVGLTYFTRSRK